MITKQAKRISLQIRVELVCTGIASSVCPNSDTCQSYVTVILQNTTPLITKGHIKYSGWVNAFCSPSGTHPVTHIKNQMISHIRYVYGEIDVAQSQFSVLCFLNCCFPFVVQPLQCLSAFNLRLLSVPVLLFPIRVAKDTMIFILLSLLKLIIMIHKKNCFGVHIRQI